MPNVLLDAAGRPRNKGRRYPGDPPTVEEIVAGSPQGLRS